MRICIAQNVNIAEHLALSTYLRNISIYLAKKDDIEVTLLPQKGLHIPAHLPQDIQMSEVNGNLYSISGNIRYSLSLYRQLKEINKEKSIDIIHCLYPNSSLLGAVLFKRTSPTVKILYDIRSPWIDMSIARGSINRWIAPVYRKLAYFSESKLSRYVDGYIFITEGLKEFYEDKIRLDSKPIDIIPSGIDLELFSKKEIGSIRSDYNISDDSILIGYVGGVSRMRQLDFVLRAFKELSDKDYRLMIVGEGNDRYRLEKLSREFQMQDKVVFTGNVTYEDVPYYISAFDVGVCHLPDTLNFRYSYPMKILEYLACGIPVLASKIEAHENISQVIPNVYLYTSPTDFQKQIWDIINNKPDPPDISEYGWDSICDSIAGIYQRIIGSIVGNTDTTK